jgi:hypothetical protein
VGGGLVTPYRKNLSRSHKLSQRDTHISCLPQVLEQMMPSFSARYGSVLRLRRVMERW